MMSFRRLAGSTLVVVLLAIPLSALIFVAGCRKSRVLDVETNLAPDTRLASAPASYTQTSYRVHLYWQGDDPDGYVSSFYFAWDDTMPAPGSVGSVWEWTTKTDSLFEATIDNDTETRFHIFYVRAVDNEGMMDPVPARIRFTAATVQGVVDSLYRLYGPEDPNGGNYDPGYKDTVLMGTPCEFKWSGYDPDGLGAPVRFSYRLDSNVYSPFSDQTYVVLPDSVTTEIRSRMHIFWVRTRDETGSTSFPENYEFVMNYEPDSDILEPLYPVEPDTTFPDRQEVWFRWTARDREEIVPGPVGGGVKEVWIELDSGFQKGFSVSDSTGYDGEWYFTSSTFPASEHYIGSINVHVGAGGGNRPHEFRVYAKDVEDRFETPKRQPSDNEVYRFMYNFPPTTEILYPGDGDTVCPDFTARWQGYDVDGGIRAYQYVLDPEVNSFRETELDSMDYEDIAPGPHRFWVAARDESECWQEGYTKIAFWVEECE